ncbi:MAG TPA: chloride channel protein, partial [Bryobacteraceae bacterium]|nr:chloride channel protein [Bryobacteraceae bacterium]
MTPVEQPETETAHADHPHFRWPAFTEPQRLLALSIFIGIFAGLLVVCFHIAIEFVNWSALVSLSDRFPAARVIVPAVGAAIASFLVLRVFRSAQGSGVNQTKAAIYVSDGYVSSQTIPGKFLACSIAIGSGNSLGPEDPALQMGAGVASLLGRMFGLHRETMRLIAPIGAAAGIAAAFNTPIAGVLFVMEEVLASWNASVLGSIVLSAVSAVVVERWFLGNEPLFRVPVFEFLHPSELLVYAAIGVVCGLLSALFIKVVAFVRHTVDRFPRWMHYMLPIIGGTIVGLVGLFLPGVMGAGYGTIDQALHDRFIWQMLIALGLAKALVTVCCFGAGIPGGMFAPALFIGAMLGGGLGGLSHRFWPFPSSSSDAYVLVGMGTFFAGVFRAPMTSIFMVFEISASYVIILPVMIANTISYLISRALQPVPFFTMLARQEGFDLPSAEEKRVASVLRVEDAMRLPTGQGIDEETSVAESLATARKNQLEFVLVNRHINGWACVPVTALEQAASAGRGSAAVEDAVPLRLAPRLYPDMTL